MTSDNEQPRSRHPPQANPSNVLDSLLEAEEESPTPRRVLKNAPGRGEGEEAEWRPMKRVYTSRVASEEMSAVLNASGREKGMTSEYENARGAHEREAYDMAAASADENARAVARNRAMMNADNVVVLDDSHAT